MALVKFGTIIVGVRGTVGGATLSANKAGPYAKQWAKGANPKSNKQMTGRSSVAFYAQRWQLITAAQRTLWNSFASAPAQQKINSLGEPYFVSGFNWFVACNRNIRKAGDVQIDAPPFFGYPTVPTVSSLAFRSTLNPSESVIRTNVADPLKTMKKACFLSIVNSAGRVVGQKQPPLMAIKQVQIGGAGDGHWNFKAEMEARFGTIFAGQKAFLSLVNQSAEGLRSPAFTTTGTFIDVG